MNYDELLAVLIRLAYVAGMGRQPTVAEWQAATALVQPNGVNVHDVIIGIVSTPEAVAYQKLLGAVLGSVRATAAAQAALTAATQP